MESLFNEITSIEKKLKSIRETRKKYDLLKKEKEKKMLILMERNKVTEYKGIKKEKLAKTNKKPKLTKDEKNQIEVRKRDFIKNTGITQPEIFLEKLKNMKPYDD